ncbi:MAG TPA: glycoside hydrolase family protein [Bradyrhizobium sp.]|nr:glycoside hydrolase family protein [Bradyrhizobium sp.]
MTRAINAAGLAIVKANEGLRLTAYRDIAGIETIGYGHTPATPGQQITPAQAGALLSADLAWAEDTVAAAARSATDNQFSAMVSLTFNVGPAAFRSSSVLRLHLAGDFSAAADAFLEWDKAHVNGALIESAGLLRRRGEEKALYLTPDAAPVAPVTRQPDIMAIIRQLQVALSTAGFYTGAVDGICGPLTIAAIRAAQAG